MFLPEVFAVHAVFDDHVDHDAEVDEVHRIGNEADQRDKFFQRFPRHRFPAGKERKHDHHCDRFHGWHPDHVLYAHVCFHHVQSCDPDQHKSDMIGFFPEFRVIKRHKCREYAVHDRVEARHHLHQVTVGLAHRGYVHRVKKPEPVYHDRDHY